VSQESTSEPRSEREQKDKERKKPMLQNAYTVHKIIARSLKQVVVAHAVCVCVC
jgi:hypothetical protein